MAEQVPTPSTALARIKEQLTCPVCLIQFDSPKTLPCLHSFCLKCIKQLPVDLEKGKYVISCPTCRKTAQVPNNGPAHLPTAFVINTLVEIEEQLRKVSEGKKSSCDNCEEGQATSYCKQCAIGFCEACLSYHNKLKPNAKHQIMDIKDVVITASQLRPVKEEIILNCTDHNEPLKIFCETCQELICQNCTVRRHKDHVHDVVSDTFLKHRQDIDNVLQVLVNKMLALQDALAAIATREEDVARQRDDRIKEIRLQIQGIVELVQQTGEQLEGEVNSVAKEKIQLLDLQKRKAELAVAQVKKCAELVEKGLEVGSQQQILSEKKNLIEGMEILSTQINLDVFQPVEEANITFIGNGKLVESCTNIGEINSFCFSDDGNVKVSCPRSSMADRKVTATLNFQTKLGSPYKIPPSLPLTCHLISPNTSQAIVCDIKETEVGKHSVSFTPSARGKHQLKIQVGGIDIGGSPFSLYVSPSPEMRSQEGRVIPVKEPCGIAIDNNGQLLVAEMANNCITIYSEKGEKLRSLGLEEKDIKSSHGVAVTTDGHILVTDKQGLKKLNQKGHCVMSVGAIGRGQLQFFRPAGIAVHPTTGQIYVADSGNNCIQVINGDFTYSHSIGSVQGRLKSPWDVALDAEGNLYVTNWGNHSIEVFTSDGMHLRQFGSKGADGHLLRPYAITIDAYNIVYVAEKAIIAIFNTDGVFLNHIKDWISNSPQYGITVDPLGNLYVSDAIKNSVSIL